MSYNSWFSGALSSHAVPPVVLVLVLVLVLVVQSSRLLGIPSYAGNTAGSLSQRQMFLKDFVYCLSGVELGFCHTAFSCFSLHAALGHTMACMHAGYLQIPANSTYIALADPTGMTQPRPVGGYGDPGAVVDVTIL
jgi:hypothetical protein